MQIFFPQFLRQKNVIVVGITALVNTSALPDNITKLEEAWIQLTPEIVSCGSELMS